MKGLNMFSKTISSNHLFSSAISKIFNLNTNNKLQNQSIFNLYQHIFILLKWVGIFPYDFYSEHHKSNSTKSSSFVSNKISTIIINITEEISFSNKKKTKTNLNHLETSKSPCIFLASKRFQWLHYTSIIIFSIYKIFLIIQLFKTFFEVNLSTSELAYILGTIVWIFSTNVVLATLIIFYRKQKAIYELVNHWYRIETFIRSQNPNGKRPRTRKFLQILFIVLATGSMIGSFFNQRTYPRHPVYLYSLLSPKLELPWFKSLSIGINQIAMLVTQADSSLLLLFAIIFTDSIAECLELSLPLSLETATTATTSNKIHTTTTLDKIQSIANALDNYDMIKSLVVEFNQIFAQLLIYVKFLCLCNLCIVIYIPIHFYSMVPFVALFLFLPAAIAIAFRLYLILSSMGVVYVKSIQFKESCAKILATCSVADDDDNVEGNSEILRKPVIRKTPRPAFKHFFNNNKFYQSISSRLQFTLPIQFRCGDFYDVYPSTILTFFSIVTTYLIFLLQI